MFISIPISITGYTVMLFVFDDIYFMPMFIVVLSYNTTNETDYVWLEFLQLTFVQI